MSRPTADRNLLFGILALQLDFLSQGALIEGLNAWVLDKSKPLGDILVERGALRRDAQAVLEALVEKHLEMHDADTDKSLASLRTQTPLRLDVGQITDPEVQATLSGADQDFPPTVPPAPGDESPAVGKPTSAGQRFRILRPHARGGLGEVFLAQDEELQREVALKEIQGRWANHAPSRARFLLEAAITGGLEHPGIVPVYGLGAYPDGRPYYAMRFIKGDSLQDALRRFHQADQGNRDPGQRTLELRQLLDRFVDVCNAVGYAHSRGVLHRDLKPANVMLGPYGETLVVDWGLAKTVGRTEGPSEVAEQTLRPESASDSAPTQAGAVLGTPPYMSPEQAAGRLEQLGPASDVYSLGATLYALLTGKAPFEGNDVGTILQRVQRGDLPPPRQVKAKVPAALEAVCLKAMALKPEDRYSSARALAEEVERWLADEPVAAYREPWRMRARRWVVRHRTLASAATTAVLLAVLAGGLVYALLERQRREQQELWDKHTAPVVNVALGEALVLRQQAGSLADQPQRTAALWRDAVAAAERAEQAIASAAAADPPTRERVESLLGELRAEAAEADKHRRMLQQLDKARHIQETDLRDSDYVRPQVLQEGLVIWGLAASPAYAAAFREYGIDLEKLTTSEAGERIRQQPIRPQLAAALDDWFALDPDAVGGQLLEVCQAADPDPLRTQVRAAIAQKDRQTLTQLARTDTVTKLPAATLMLCARVLHQQGLRGEAIQLMKRAQQRYPDDFWVNDMLGLHLAHGDAPDYAEVGRCYAAAIALRPNNAVGWGNLGYVLELEGRLDAAVAAYRESIRVNPDFVTSYLRLSRSLSEKGEWDQAFAVVRDGLRRRPDSPMLLQAQGEVQSAKGETKQAIDTFQKVLARNPEWVHARVPLARALSQTGQTKEALQILENLEKAYPKRVEFTTAKISVLLHTGDREGALQAALQGVELAPWEPWGWSLLGTAYLRNFAPDKAVQAYRKAVQLVPTNGMIRVYLANALVSQGNLEEAVAMAREASRLAPGNVSTQLALARGLFAQERYADAASAYRAAVNLDPANAGSYFSLSGAYYRAEDYNQAAEAARQSIQIAPKQSNGYNHLANALDAQGKLDKAIDQYRQAIALNPGSAVLHSNLADTLNKQHNVAEAEAEFRKAAKLAPINANYRLRLAILLLNQGKAAEAEAELRQAVKLAPTNSAAHARLSMALLMQGEVAKAVAAARQGVELAPSRAREHFRLGDALLAQGDFAEALATFLQAKSLRTPADDATDPPSWDERIRQSRRYLELDLLLSAVDQNKLKLTDPAEQAALAGFCRQQKHRPLTAVRFYSEAFAADPKLTDDLVAGRRFAAAGAAALAATGKGKDAANLNGKEQEGLRRKSLGWLQADLVAWKKRFDGGQREVGALIANTLPRWLRDPELSGVRDPDALAKLPAEERVAWQRLWADVEYLLGRARTAQKE